MKQVQAVVFDWAGTIVDFGSFAPTSIFVEAFKKGFDFDVTLAEARVPMGLGKWDHIQALGKLPAVKERWVRQFGHEMTDEEIDHIYATFMPLQKAVAASHVVPIPQALEVVDGLREQGIKIGSCTGYPREIMDIVIPAAKKIGYSPDCTVATDDLAFGGRPNPYMILQNAIELGVTNVNHIVKVDDSKHGIYEGHNAGTWTVALLMSGNAAGFTLEEYENANPEQIVEARNRAYAHFEESRPHYTIDTVADLPRVIANINKRIKNGERP